jgi:Fe-S-cluster-containing hydrogenase component 2
MVGNVIIVRNSGACYGCRACELACSFHHKRAFSTEFSDIHVSRNNRTGEIKWVIEKTCDSCAGEERPLCVKYCAYGALKEL